jgi:hypothetical protein
MAARRWLWSLFICLTLTSCVWLAGPPPNLDEVRAEVEKTVIIGEPMTSSVAKLGAKGYGCTGIKPVQCGFSKNSCVVHLDLVIDENYRVVRTELYGPNCLYTP